MGVVLQLAFPGVSRAALRCLTPLRDGVWYCSWPSRVS